MPCTIGGFNDGEHRIESTCRHIYDFGGDAMDELLLALLRRQAVPGPPNSSSSGSWHSKSSGALAAALRRACCHLHFDGDATRDSVQPLAPTVSGSSGAAAAARAQGAQRVEAALGSFAHLPPLALFAPTAVPAAAKADAAHAAASKAAAAAAAASTPSPAPPRDFVEPELATDLGDIWGDDFLLETRLERAGMERVGENRGVVYLGTSVVGAPTPTELGARHHAPPPKAVEAAPFAPLDETVVRLVERGKATEVKRRLYSNVLLIGGCANTPGLAPYLEWRLSSCWKLGIEGSKGVQAVEGIERIEVQKPPRGVAPDELVWQGGATLPALGGASKLWILQQEWERRGAQAARDVCPFAW